MFWFWIAVSVVGYSVQGVLTARYARELEVLSAGFYRNSTLVFSMAPVLLFVPWEAWAMVLPTLPWLGVSALLAALSQWMRYLSLRSLPVGVSGATTTGLNVVFAVLFGWVFLDEWLSLPELLCIGLILLSVVWLVLAKNNNFTHLEVCCWRWGLGYIVSTSALLTLAFIIVTHLARTANPLLVGYLWESLIALAALALIGLRRAVGGTGLQLVTGAKWWAVLLASAPTVLGTVGFVMAIQHGPMALAAGVSATTIVLTTLLSAKIYHEKLCLWQYGAIALTMLGVGALRWLG